MKKGTSRALTKEQKAEIKALANLPDEKIDTTDIPEILDWSGAKRGLLYRPVKRQITLRLDADVVAWFRANAPGGRGYQTEIQLRVTHSVAFNEKFPEQLVNPPLQRSYSRAQLSHSIFRLVSLETPSTSRNSSTAWGKSESPWG